MKTIALITAMSCEYDAIYSLYDFKEKDGIAKAEVYGLQIILLKSGIGKVNSALKTDFAIRQGAELVINTGLAGGIDDSLDQGDVVLATSSCYHDVWCGSPNSIGQVQDFPLYYDLEPSIKEVLQPKLKVLGFKMGLTVTGDQFLTDINRLKQIKSDFKEALAVDMESASVAQTCYIHNIPYISLRIISDVVGKTSQMEQYESFWQNMPKQASQMVDDLLKALN